MTFRAKGALSTPPGYGAWRSDCSDPDLVQSCPSRSCTQRTVSSQLLSLGAKLPRNAFIDRLLFEQFQTSRLLFAACSCFSVDKNVSKVCRGQFFDFVVDFE